MGEERILNLTQKRKEKHFYRIWGEPILYGEKTNVPSSGNGFNSLWRKRRDLIGVSRRERHRLKGKKNSKALHQG